MHMMGSTPLWSHATTLDATPTSASEARAFVLHHLVDHRLLHLVDPVRLVASELATNALVHAQTTFEVALSARADSVLLTVRDDSALVPAGRSADVMDSSGRGLDIVAFVSSDWGWSEDGAGSKTVWASFALR
jgi:two-component sensor histidine kinase